MQCELRKAKYLEIDRLVRTGPMVIDFYFKRHSNRMKIG